MSSKFLNYEGLTTYHNKIKSVLSNKLNTIDDLDGNSRLTFDPIGLIMSAADGSSVLGAGFLEITDNYTGAGMQFRCGQFDYTPVSDTYRFSFPNKTGTLAVGSVRSSKVTINSASSTSSRYYPVEINTDGAAFVNVPWTNTNTNYYHTPSYTSGLSIATGSGVNTMYVPIAGTNTTGVVKGFHRTSGTATGTQTTNATNAPAINARTTTSGRYYGVETDAVGKMFVNVPWSNTTYSAGDGISISGTTISSYVNCKSLSYSYSIAPGGQISTTLADGLYIITATLSGLLYTFTIYIKTGNSMCCSNLGVNSTYFLYYTSAKKLMWRNTDLDTSTAFQVNLYKVGLTA